MMMLDSCICVPLLRALPEEVARFSKARDLALGELMLSAIVLAELERGIALRHGRQQQSAYAWLLDATRVVPFDDMAARTAGRINAELQQRGSKIDFADSLIAAHALSLDLPLATFNTKHFARVPGLRLVDWAAA